jgi:DNA-binding transcriptional LysR family regulator
MAMDWDDLRLFLAIARARSLTEAAHELGVNQSTVSRRLAAMERALDARLIERVAGGHALTAAGTELHATASNVAEEVARIDRRVAGRNARLSGRLRVTCTDNFSNSYLAPHFARFAALHPDIDLDVATRYQHLSLARREADVAIRTTVKPADTLIGRRLFRFALAVYGATEVVAGLDQRPDPADLPWIGWDNEAYNRLMILNHFPTAQIRHRADSLLDMRSLARAGLGVAVIGCFAADPDPGLRRVYPEAITDNKMDLWVLSHPDLWRAARVRAFTSFIADAFLADRDLFEGRRPRLLAAGDNADPGPS